MNEVLSGLINNIFFILFPLFIYQLFINDTKGLFFQNHKIVLTVLYSISITLCTLFPYQLLLPEGFQFDLRQIPLIIGALYGGYHVGWWLFLVSVIVRFFSGGLGEGFYIAVINQFAIFLIVPLIKTYYFKLVHHKRVLTVSFIALCSLWFNALIGWALFNDAFYEAWDFWLMLMLNQFIFTAITAIFIEQIIKNNYIQQSIMKNEKLDIVSHLAASISHEIRNPLQVIKGFVQFLKTDAHDKDKEKEYLEIMEKEVDSAELIISDYLTFAKSTYDKVEEIDTKEEIEKVTSIIQAYANYSSVDVVVLDLEKDLTIIGDRQKLKQCLVNISRNCIESMPNGGVLTIRSELVDNDRLSITFNDTGNGMTDEQILRLGEPYFSTKEDGTGLGMMVVYSIIKNMNGSLKVESEIGKGTTFTIILPIE